MSPRDRTARGPAPRRRMATWAVSLIVASGAAGWVAASHLTSSAEAAATHQPPAASIITATVEQRALTVDVITRGTLARADERSLAAIPPEDPAVGAVVTLMPLVVGEQMREGERAVEVGGRPVFALGGALPVFRDLRVGDRGVDVDQLRVSLHRLKLLSTAAPGSFDASVVTALERLYRAAGYSPPNGGKSAVAAVSRANADRLAALAELDRLRSGRRSVSHAERLAAEAAVAAARDNLAVVDAQTAAAVGKAERTRVHAQQDLATADAAAATAADRLRQAEAGHDPDTGDAPTAARLHQLQLEANQTRADADAMAEKAREASDDARTAALQRTSLMDSARAALDVAQATLDDLGQAAPASAAELQVAQANVAAANQALADAQRQAATYLPRSEVVYVPQLPARVTKVMLGRGDAVAGPFVAVAGSSMRIDTALPSSTRATVKPGITAVVDDVGTGTQFKALVVSVASTPATEGEFAGRFPVVLDPIAPPAQAVGLSLRIRFPVNSTVDTALIVPATALSTGTDGSVFVERLTGSRIERVPVAVGLTSAGLAEVVPQDGDDLPAGSKVVVGLAEGRPE